MKQFLKRAKIYALALLILFVFISCNNNRVVMPLFSATGYWRDGVSTDPIGILNRPDGTSRLYLLNNQDTVFALHKYDGSYVVRGNVFRFQSYTNGEGSDIYMEAKRNLSGTMTGVLVIRSSPDNRSDFVFSNKKQ